MRLHKSAIRGRDEGLRPARLKETGPSNIKRTPNHETLDDGEWQKVEANAFIFHIDGLPDAVSRHLLEYSEGFHRTCGDKAAESFWANHCPHCASAFSDDELHCEPGGFMPSDALEAQSISLTHVQQAFSALAAGYALEPEFFASMRVR